MFNISDSDNMVMLQGESFLNQDIRDGGVEGLNIFNKNKIFIPIKTEEFIINNYLNILIEKYKISLKYCFKELETIKNNPFIKNTFEKIENILFKNIRFIKILKKYLYKKENENYEYPITEDLNFNKLSCYDKCDIINIKDNQNKRYWSFYYKDMIQLLKNSINNNEENFPNPMVPRNPYTNQEFTEGNLYKIFSSLINKDLPLELYLYYKHNFSRREMLSYHWYYFTEKACNNFVKNMDKNEFLSELKYSLSNFLKVKDYDWANIKSNQNIKNIFEKIIIKIHLYENVHKDIDGESEIKKELLEIIKKNSFNRKIIKVKRNFKIIKNYNFINDDDKQNYMKDGIFIFGGNDEYKLCKNILNEIVEESVKYYRGEIKFDKQELLDAYQGELKDNKKHGKGKMVFCNNDTYEGDWVNDKISGYGVYTYYNSEEYSGEWLNNKKHGKGILKVFKNMKEYKQIYNNGKLIDSVLYNDPQQIKEILTQTINKIEGIENLIFNIGTIDSNRNNRRNRRNRINRRNQNNRRNRNNINNRNIFRSRNTPYRNRINYISRQNLFDSDSESESDSFDDTDDNDEV